MDNDPRCKLPLRKGPFSTFKLDAPNDEYRFTSEATSQDYSSIQLLPEKGPRVKHFNESALPADLDDWDTEMTKPPDLIPTPGLPLLLPLINCLNDVAPDIIDTTCIYTDSAADCEEIPDEYHAPSITGPSNNHFDSMSLTTYLEPETLDHSLDPTQTALLTPYVVTHLPIQHIHIRLSEDADIDMLMQHYVVNVADVLQPIRHLHNTYRDLYVPMALEGALIPTSDPKAASKKAQSALFHALLASAAFHLWNCNKAKTKFQKMGTQHRYHALRLLQSAIDSATLGVNYRSLLMAMLALVTIGVSGLRSSRNPRMTY
jgi:hypothetical protein